LLGESRADSRQRDRRSTTAFRRQKERGHGHSFESGSSSNARRWLIFFDQCEEPAALQALLRFDAAANAISSSSGYATTSNVTGVAGEESARYLSTVVPVFVMRVARVGPGGKAT